MPFTDSIEWHESLPSTMQTARDRALAGAPQGLVITAREQTAGRGRLGRTWSSPKGGLWFSLVLRPPLPPEKLGLLGLAFGVAAADTLIQITGLPMALKWPNDLYLSQRKLGGFLLESHLQSDRVEFVILGLGLNVNIPADSFPAELRPQATSLLIETAHEYSPESLLRAILDAAEGRYAAAIAPIVARWNELDAARGRPLRVQYEGHGVEGTAAGLSPDGALLVETPSGQIALHSGEVQWL